MHDFKRRDIVRLKDFKGDIEYYEVADVIIDLEKDREVSYKIGKVFPMTSRRTVFEMRNEDELQLVASYGDKDDYDSIKNFLIKEKDKYIDKDDSDTHLAILELKSSDECLDMINHLKTLHRIFGKEIHLKYIKDVEKKLIELS